MANEAMGTFEAVDEVLLLITKYVKRFFGNSLSSRDEAARAAAAGAHQAEAG